MFRSKGRAPSESQTRKLLLDCVTYMVLFIRRSEQVLRVRTSSTCECNGQFAQAENLPRGFELAHRQLWPLAPSSLPLSSTSPKRWWTATDSRSEECFYCQVAGFVDLPSPPASSARRPGHQPVGGRGTARLAQLASRPWLSASASTESVAKINMCMIVSRRKRYRKFITGWCAMSRSANTPPR